MLQSPWVDTEVVSVAVSGEHVAFASSSGIVQAGSTPKRGDESDRNIPQMLFIFFHIYFIGGENSHIFSMFTPIWGRFLC